MAGWLLGAGLWAAEAPIPPGPPTAAAGAEASVRGDVEVLLRGPIHEAFATQVGADAAASLAVSKEPPAPISEIPPRHRPRGNNISWIPGYHAWDDEREDFIWISGVWRAAPPGRRWLPGYWLKVDGGWRWHAGAWVRADAQTIGYLPPPQPNIEQGPTSPPPSDNHFWVPGCWVYRDRRYQWRPGLWAEGRPGWCWVPEYYLRTPRGVVHVSGYWDYPLAARGTLFAPVALHVDAAARVALRYTPTVVIEPARIMLHLFVRPGYHHYYFGDYYGEAYVGAGIHPWFEFRTARRGFDPLLTHYVWHNARQGVRLVDRLTSWHAHFLAETALRPPRTLAAVGDFVARHEAVAHANLAVVGQPLADVLATTDGAARFVGVSAGEITSLTGTAQAMHRLADLRLGVETGAVVGDVVPGTVEGVVGAAAQAVPSLKLPVITEPLHRAAPGVIEAVPGVGRAVPGALPAVPRVERALPVEPSVPLLRGLPGGLLD